MNLSNELIYLVNEKFLINKFSNDSLKKIPRTLINIAVRNNLFHMFQCDTEAIKRFVREEQIPALDWISKNRGKWTHKEILVLAIIANKRAVIEWIDSVMNPCFKADNYFNFKAVTVGNDWAVEFLRYRGYHTIF